MHLNILSFQPVQEIISVNLYTEKQLDTHPLSVFKDEFPKLWASHKLDEKQCLFFSFANEETECKGTSFQVEINLLKNIRIALHYFRHLIFEHFKIHADAVCNNFVDGIEVWIKSNEQKNKETTAYHKYTLNPRHARVSDGFELLVSYNGTSTVYNTSVSQLSEVDSEKFTLVVVNHELAKFNRLTQEQKQYIETTYPVINFNLARILGIPKESYINPNKYISTLKQIEGFYKSQLLQDYFKAVLNINSNGFLKLNKVDILTTKYDSNTLHFARNHTNADVISGMKVGPFSPPTVPQNNVHFFFIFQKDKDYDTAVKLHNIFTKGLYKEGFQYPVFKPLSEYIKQPFHTEKNGSITFSSPETALEEIEKGILEKKSTNGATYVAIYISPIHKDDIEHPQHNLYFKVKELLLDKGITSQAIYNERHNDEYFSFHLPNIAIAILAKLGGIPWRLNPSLKEDLIIGIGAFKSQTIGERYVGSAFCFNKEGIFQNFSCHRDNELDQLIADIRKAIGHYVVEHETANRLIIHYYKTMRKADSDRIVNMLYRLGLKIPVIIVTINKTETDDIVAFNTQVSDLMPLSGTIIPVGSNQYLLYNSAKYDESYKDKKTKKDYPFPIKLKIAVVNKEDQLQVAELKEIIDQVYQFSRMYWKSVKQQNLPVTIKYPEIVAEIVPHFTNKELSPFGKSNLWFL